MTLAHGMTLLRMRLTGKRYFSTNSQKGPTTSITSWLRTSR